MSRISARTGALCFVLFALLGSVAASCGSASTESVNCVRDGIVLEEGLEIRDLDCGSGRIAATGMTLTVRYETELEDGTPVERPRASGDYTFRLGAGQVVPGWDLGLPGMAVGGTRALVVPPELAYGSAGLHPDIPPGATVAFEVELLEAREAEEGD